MDTIKIHLSEILFRLYFQDLIIILCVCPLGFAATVLQKAQVRIINHSVCDDLMGGQITSRMLCAGVLIGGVDACQVINSL